MDLPATITGKLITRIRLRPDAFKAGHTQTQSGVTAQFHIKLHRNASVQIPAPAIDRNWNA